MGLRERIYETLKTTGAMTDAALAARLGRPEASVRRSRQQLVLNEKVERFGSGKPRLWRLLVTKEGNNGA